MPQYDEGACRCSFSNCPNPPAIECQDCGLGGVLLCAAHDAEQHSSAHRHHRCGLLGGFKQPLQPSQQYRLDHEGCSCVCAANHAVQTVPLFYDLAPGKPCSCGAAEWVMDAAGAGASPQQLIVLTSTGKAPVVRVAAAAKAQCT